VVVGVLGLTLGDEADEAIRRHLAASGDTGRSAVLAGVRPCRDRVRMILGGVKVSRTATPVRGRLDRRGALSYLTTKKLLSVPTQTCLKCPSSRLKPPRSTFC
jgi:hypothetical protein